VHQVGNQYRVMCEFVRGQAVYVWQCLLTLYPSQVIFRPSLTEEWYMCRIAAECVPPLVNDNQ